MEFMLGQALFLLFCFILSCFPLICTTRSRRKSFGAAATPPGPPRLPIIGNIHLVGKNPHRSVANFSKTYGPIMSVKFGSLNTVIIASPEAESDVEFLGFMVPKDTQVLVNVWAIGRDPSVWENPTRFEPERFLGKEVDVRGRDYELTPFGAGRRICPGLPLAVKTVPLMLASLLYCFDWKLPNGINSEDLDMDETFGLTLHKTNPLHAVAVRKRH